MKHKPQLAPGIELAMVKHDGGVLRAPVHVSLPGMRTRTVVTLHSVDLARPIVLMACSEPRNWFTALARHNGPQVVTITLVDDLLSEYVSRLLPRPIFSRVPRPDLTGSGFQTRHFQPFACGPLYDHGLLFVRPPRAVA